MARTLGADEAGRGPVLGPLVIAAVAVDDPTDLDGLDLRDSKELTAARRTELGRAVHDRAEVAFAVVSAEEIDALRDRWSLNRIELDGFERALRELGAGGTAYVDAADVDAKGFGRRLTDRLDGTAVIAEHRADQRYPVVSAASIVAKVERDRRMAAIAQDLGRETGSGYPSDPNTVAFLERWVREEGDLPPHTRRSWESARRLLSARDQQRITDF